MTCKTVKKVVQSYLPIFLRYNQFMKLLLTILLGLLLVQVAVGLHLHTEGEDAGNATVSDNANSTQSAITEEDLKIQQAQKNYDAIQASGDEELIAAAKEAREAFEAAGASAKEKVEAAGKLSDDATIEEGLNALQAVALAQSEFTHSLDELSKKLEELKKKLDEKQANTGASS